MNVFIPRNTSHTIDRRFSTINGGLEEPEIEFFYSNTKIFQLIMPIEFHYGVLYIRIFKCTSSNNSHNTNFRATGVIFDGQYDKELLPSYALAYKNLQGKINDVIECSWNALSSDSNDL